MKAFKEDLDNVDVPEGLDNLAILAVLGEDEATPASQATTKHPRHRPGCSCIVCIQPPSGKGPKHKQTCTCNVCLTVKRRFHTLMMRREKKQSDKEAESTRKMQQQPLLGEKLPEDEPTVGSGTGNGSPNRKKEMDEGFDDEHKVKSPYKGQIDLNIQPEREEELSSPGSDPSSMMKLLNEKCLKEENGSSVQQGEVSNSAVTPMTENQSAMTSSVKVTGSPSAAG